LALPLCPFPYGSVTCGHETLGTLSTPNRCTPLGLQAQGLSAWETCRENEGSWPHRVIAYIPNDSICFGAWFWGRVGHLADLLPYATSNRTGSYTESIARWSQFRTGLVALVNRTEYHRPLLVDVPPSSPSEPRKASSFPCRTNNAAVSASAFSPEKHPPYSERHQTGSSLARPF